MISEKMIDALLLTRVSRCVLIVDIVESVRLIQSNESSTIVHWLEIVRFVKEHLEAHGGGRLVKSLGDGLLLEFDNVLPAMRMAFDVLGCSRDLNARLEDDDQVHLRMGLELTEVLVGEDDIYGHGVNMAARLATLARPGEIITSSAVRENITPDFDADVEDMGECYLKHIKEPVRAFRIGPPGPRPAPLRVDPTASMLPTLAVVPFSNGGTAVVGEVLAEELIRALSQSSQVNVISRMSTRAFRHASGDARLVGDHLQAHYVLTGRVMEHDKAVSVSLQLTETRTDTVVWAERMTSKLADILMGDQDLVVKVTSAIGKSILKREFDRARTLPLPTVESYGLLLGSISAMYRLSRSEFERAGEILEHLIDREPRQPLPLAWKANWHVLKVQQGWTDNPETERRLALGQTGRALDLDSENDVALTFNGFVQTNLFRDFEAGEEQYDKALLSNPNASLAWLLKGMMHAFRGEGDLAVEFCGRAQSLSPFDPQRFFYDSLNSGAYISAGDYAQAEKIALRSLKANSTHTSTLRSLAIAQWQLGKHEEARATVQKLTVLEPGLTRSNWLKKNPGAKSPLGEKLIDILMQAGLPE